MGTYNSGNWQGSVAIGTDKIVVNAGTAKMRSSQFYHESVQADIFRSFDNTFINLGFAWQDFNPYTLALTGGTMLAIFTLDRITKKIPTSFTPSSRPTKLVTALLRHLWASTVAIA